MQADAEAICEAVARPNMRFVPVKNAEQQAVLSTAPGATRVCQGRTAQANQIRGLLAEFGIVIPQASAYCQASAGDWKTGERTAREDSHCLAAR